MDTSGFGNGHRRLSRWLSAAVLVVIVPAAAAGQPASPPAPVLTLDKAVELALAGNRDVKNAALEVRKAGEQVAAARTRRLPQLDFSVYESRHLTDESYTFKQGSLGDSAKTGPIPAEDTKIQTAPDFTTLVTTDVTLPLSQQYRIGLSVDQLEISKQMAGQQLRSARQKTAKDVRQAYYAILQSRSALAASEKDIKFLRSFNALVDRYVAEQRALKSDSLEVQTKLAQAEQQAFSERNALASEKEQLNLLLGRDVDTEFSVTDVPAAGSLKIDDKAARADALAQRPLVNQARLKVKHAEYGVSIKKSQYLPDISLAARYTSPFGIKLLPENIATVGVLARWDVFDWGRRGYEVEQKSAEVQQAKNQLRDAEDRTLLDVNKKVRALQNAQQLVPVARLAQATATEKLRVTLQKYQAKAALIEDVLKAQSQVQNADHDYEDAQLAVRNAWAELQRARGEE